MGVSAFGCQSGGIGDPCVPEDEYQQYFSGYEVTEVNIESKSFQCETRLCLVNHFNGRVSCPYGQSLREATGMDAKAEEQLCHIPGTTSAATRIKVEVQHQYDKRKAADTVYCSCRCAGADSNARYCKCPTGFQCSPLLDAIKVLGSVELAGSYCIKNGTQYNTTSPDNGLFCQVTDPNAAPPNPPGDCGLYNGQ
jgi:hypothetical protein